MVTDKETNRILIAFKTLPKEQRRNLLRLLLRDEGVSIEEASCATDSSCPSGRLWTYLRRECKALGIYLCPEGSLTSKEKEELKEVTNKLLEAAPKLAEDRKAVHVEVFLSYCAHIVAHRVAKEEQIFGRPSTFVIRSILASLDKAFPNYRSSRLLHLVVPSTLRSKDARQKPGSQV